MANYLDLGTDGIQQRKAPATAGGAGNENKIPELNGSGVLPESMLPSSALGGTTIVNATADGAISQHDLVEVFNDSGTIKARKADATSGTARPATGRANAAAVDAAAVEVTVGPHSYNAGTHGLTLGADNPIFLSKTAGGRTQTPPLASGELTQVVGYAVTSTTIYLNIKDRGILNNF